MDEHPTEDLDFDQTDYEFATGQRKCKRQTEEERIYGIWALDDEDDRPSFSGSGGRKRPKDSAPVQFVSGGVKVGSKTQFEFETQFENVTTEEVKVDDEITIIDARPEKRARPSTSSASASGFANDGFGTAGFGAPGFDRPEVGSQVFAGMRGFQQASGPVDSNWLKGGKGNVIMQMMQKMGYEHGKGLGKDKQGIVEPVQAVQRPGRGAVGAYGSEAQGPKFGESAAEAQARIHGGTSGSSSSSTVPIPPPPGGQWKKSNAGRPVRIQYKTLDEVISDGQAQRFGGMGAPTGGSSMGKIIDMTGPEQKVYDDFTSFSRRAKMPYGGDTERAHFNLPELTHNLNTLLDVTEEEICKTHGQIRQLKDQNEVLAAENERKHVEIVGEQHDIDRLKAINSTIRSFYHSGKSSLEDCKAFFIKLRDEYATEYTLYGLDAIAIPILLPKIKAHFMQWDPLDPEQTSYGHAMMTEWKSILCGTRGGSLFRHFDKETNTSISAFDHCIWSGWMPQVRRAALAWNPRSNGPVMVSLVQLWMPLLPGWVVENFLEQVLVPRLKAEVDQWDPINDQVPIETWLHPWHPIMGDRLLLTYATLRQKLAKAFRAWAPGDRSAIEVMRPWKEIFSASTMHAFASMNIMPKFEKALQEIDISTTEEFDYLELFDWLEMVNADVIGQMVAKHFFPRYYQQLCSQLNSPKVTMTELDKLKQEYAEWKNLMPVEIQNHELVMAEFKRVLIAILHAQNRLLGKPMPGTSTSASTSYGTTAGGKMPPGPFGLPPPPAQFTAQLPPSSFKQLVESSAVSNGIQFFPQRGKFHEGKQVYMFGDHSVYIDGTILHYYSPPKRQWLPTGLNQLLDMCRNG